MPSPDQHIRKALTTLKAEISDLQKELDEKEKKAGMLAGYLGVKQSKPTKRKTRKKRWTRKKGGLTIEAAIIQAVSAAKKALSTSDIVAALKSLRVGAAKQSVYGTISRMKLSGLLKSVAHSGRGDAYTSGSASKKKKAGSRRSSAVVEQDY